MDAFNGKGRFSSFRRLKPLDRSIRNFEKITTVLTSCYKPAFITIAPRGSSAQYGEVAKISFASFFSLLVTSVLRNALNGVGTTFTLQRRTYSFPSLPPSLPPPPSLPLSPPLPSPPCLLFPLMASASDPKNFFGN
jgi:hypothetical protein